MKIFIRYFAIALIALLSACSTTKKEENEVQVPAEEIYEKANHELEDNNYQSAADDFAKLYGEYPYSNLAAKSMLMEAFSYYKKHDFDMAIPILNEFIKIHPAYPDIAYAYYLKALSFYSQIDNIELDQKNTEDAKNAIDEFLIKFPKSIYSRELKVKLDLINDHLAGKEMEIGRYYIHKNELLAALNRFKNVVDLYSTTNHVKEALYRLVEIHTSLGIIEEANKNAAVLGYNYPTSRWYKYAYKLLKSKNIKQQ